MAGGKETPRQKMIGMMYLFLTAMLALNVSKEVLDSFVLVNDSLTTTVENFNEKNKNIYAELESQAALNEAKVGKWNNLAKEVRKRADDISDFINDCKIEVVKTSDGEDAEAIVDGKVVAMEIKAKDDSNIGAQVMVTQGRGKELKEKIDNFRDFLLSNVDEDHPTLVAAIEKNLNTENPPPLPDGTDQTWVSQNFEHIPLVGVVTMLTKMQTDIRNSEADIVRYFYGQISAQDFKFNKLEPVVKMKSNYVLTGSEYSAEVFIAAQDTTQFPTIHVGEYESLGDGKYQMVGDFETLEIEEGKGIYSKVLNSPQDVKWGGLISMQDPTGETKYYPFESEYRVERPTAIISASANRVFYYGVPNPLEYSVPGLTRDKLRVNASNADIINYQGGKAIKPQKRGGKIVVSLSAEIDGNIKRIGSSEFSVKMIPPPTPKLEPFKISSGEILEGRLNFISGISAVLEGFIMENIKYNVTEFRVLVQEGKFTEQIDVKGSQFSTRALNKIKKLGRGQKLIITDIKAKGPDGTKQLSPLIFDIN